MTTLYVYYKVTPEQRTHCLVLVGKLQAVLKDLWPGLEIQVMQRPEAAADGTQTWMEVYAHPDGVDDEMTAAIARYAAALGLPSKRATEVFVPLRA